MGRSSGPHAGAAVLRVAQAALETVAYADVFDYAMDATEIHRYLHHLPATLDATRAALAWTAGPAGPLRVRDGFYTLPGREVLTEVRQSRAALADRMWPRAVAYGQLLASLPFVRMVAVTGSLAWDNIDPVPVFDRPPDVDYLIVAEAGRVWICRWCVALLVRTARLRGLALCPNYVISTSALTLTDRTIYTAYELARTTPVAGLETYRRLRAANGWVESYLPNAGEPSVPERHAGARPPGVSHTLGRLSRLVERALVSTVGDRIDRLEMRYRSRKRRRTEPVGEGEADYTSDSYKNHIRGHSQRILAAFAERVSALPSLVP